MQTPIFIFSIPRSGSTLLQRVLMSHKDICSIAEPWLLLPQLYNLRREGTLSEYSSLTAYSALQDFIKNLPNKQTDYNDSLKTFILDLYSKQCQNDERYFLDKTPRYYLIIDDIIKVFPEAKFIFLFRNPVHVYASAVSTWGNNRFNKLRSTYNDIILGTKLLSEGYVKHRDKSISINYENFVTNFEVELQKIIDYLDIDLSDSVLNNFHIQDTKGSLGDPTGVKKYNSISKDSLDNWKTVFNSKIRKTFAFWILKKIADKDLEVQGYNKKKIIEELKTLKSNNNHLIIMDGLDYLNSFLVRKLYLNLFFSKRFRWIKKKYLS